MPSLKPSNNSKIPETMVLNMTPSVRLQLRLVTTAEVGQMRHPPVLQITAAAAVTDAAATTAAEPSPSSVPATTQLHYTMVRVRHYSWRGARITFVEQSVERSVDSFVRRSEGTPTRPPRSSSSVVTRTMLPRPTRLPVQKLASLLLTLAVQASAVVSVSVPVPVRGVAVSVSVLTTTRGTTAMPNGRQAVATGPAKRS